MLSRFPNAAVRWQHVPHSSRVQVEGVKRTDPCISELKKIYQSCLEIFDEE